MDNAGDLLPDNFLELISSTKAQLILAFIYLKVLLKCVEFMTNFKQELKAQIAWYSECSFSGL